MDLEPVIGAGGFVATAAATVIAWVQLRRTPAPAVRPADLDNGQSRGILPPPLGRLPDQVRGREQILRTIQDVARRPDGAVHLLGGLGGTGKTTIALRVADTCLAAGRRVWWVSGADANSLASDLLDLARSLGASAQDLEEVSSGRRNPADLLWEFLEPRRGWVLVIDNADDPGALAVHGRTAGDNSGWIRPTSSGLVLITSRNIDPMAWGRHVTIHTVGWLPAEHGARVLLDLAPRAGTEPEAQDLAERLGGLPLALQHAGLHLASPFNRERSFTDYAEALRDRFPELMRAGTDDRSIVASTWRLTLDALVEGGHPEANELMWVLSRFAGGVPIRCDLLDHEILARGCGVSEGSRVAAGLRALANTGLIALGSPGGQAADAITVHPLVVEILRLQDGARRAHEDVAVDLLVAAAERLEPSDHRHASSWASLVPHVGELLEATTSRPGVPALERAAAAASRVALALGSGSQYFAARQLVEESLAATAPLGAEHSVVLELRLIQAKVTRLLGDPRAAEPIVREVLEARGRRSGSEDPDTLRARHELGLCLAAQGRITDAEEEYRKVLGARRNLLGDDHPDTLSSRQVLARIPYRLDRLDEAEREYREVHAAQRRVLGADHPGTLVTRKYIAMTLLRRQQLDEAEREFAAVLPGLRRALGPEHRHVLSVREELAAIHAARGKKRAARKEFEELLSMQRRVLGASHPGTLRTENILDELRAGRRRTFDGR